MTLDEIRFVLYRYFMSVTQRGKDLSAVCRAIGHGRIEITIQDGRPVQVLIVNAQREDHVMENKIRELIGAGPTPTT